MNPFDMGLMALNPELFATAMASQGISPNAISNPLTPPGINQADPLAAFFTGSMGGPAAPTVAAITPPNATPGAPNPGGQQPSLLSALAGVKAPQPTAPIFNGGVSGSQKAPEATAGVKNSATNQALLALLQNAGGGTAPMAVPDLASLLKGI